MGDILDIPRIRYAISTNMDHVSEFTAFADPNHQIDAHAKKLLAVIAGDETRDRLIMSEGSGMVACASLADLDFRQGVSIRETAVLAKLASIGAKPLSLAFVLDLWAAPRGTELGGVVYTDPVLNEYGVLHHLIVAEVHGIRWLYARRLDPQRVWTPEQKVIFSLL